MTWHYQTKEITELPEGTRGFVYLITNLTTGRLYIGKKRAQFKRTRPPLKGRKRRRTTHVESDWRDYWGSSDSLLKDIEAMGHDCFRREILYFCSSLSECSYLEAREQFDRRVLETDLYYNNQITVRVHGSHVLGKIVK